ncbi:ABC transporter permease [Nocardioides sp. GY 10127]|uniref:ABC transporter permease n=1 Tax=Nocardioides sp. GY 10127 TaxID=2569762 RepID=UPI0010A7F9C7|nr:ABC transporter permease [Nocardioides sp. GY 10127]TIC86607.1 ABC transporter permease [Nocardioides sp. GY 10127]
MSVVSEPALASAGAPVRRGSGYLRFAATRVAGSLGSLAFLLVLNFFLFRVLPGDPARTLGRGRFTTQEQLDAFNAAYGLDQPMLQQFVTYLRTTLHGDLGISLKYRVPVTELIADRIGPTLLLVGTSTVLAAVIGIWLGVHSAWRHGSRFDRFATGSSLTLYSMPEWWLGLLLIVVLAVGVGPVPGLFPTGGLHSVDVDVWSFAGVLDTAWHLVLPVATLTLAYLADYAMVMRSSLLDEIGADYLTTARATGLREAQVRNRHAVRNALLPTTTVVALNIGFIVTGAITVETVFSIPGLGLLATEALSVPDYWVLQGTFLVSATAVIGLNLVANLVYGLLDPRVRA